jgi:ankyrin repeat protein
MNTVTIKHYVVLGLTMIAPLLYGAHTEEAAQEERVRRDMAHQLVDAAGHGRLEIVKSLVEQGVDVNVQDPFAANQHSRALIVAIEQNQPDVVRYLVSVSAIDLHSPQIDAPHLAPLALARFIESNVQHGTFSSESVAARLRQAAHEIVGIMEEAVSRP